MRIYARFTLGVFIFAMGLIACEGFGPLPSGLFSLNFLLTIG